MSIESNKLVNLADAKVLYDDVRGRAEDIKEAIAPDYSDLTFPVAKDQHCWHDGGLYAAKDTISTSEAWTAAHWDAVTLDDEMEDALSAAKNAIKVQDATPTSDDTKIWLPATAPTSVQVPSYAEHTAVAGRVGVLEPAATSSDVGKYLKVKTVTSGKVSEYELGSAEDEVPGLVEDWLEENITNPDSPPLDRSLTSASSAAPADLVGDLSSAIDVLDDAITVTVKSKNLIDTSKLTVGRLNSSGGVSDNLTGYRTSDYILLTGGKSYVFARESLSTPQSALLMGYSGYGLYNTSKEWIDNSFVYDNHAAGTVLSITPTNDCYVRVTGGKDYFATSTDGLFILQEGTALDGYQAYFDPYQRVTALTEDDIAQTSGQDTGKIMSQKAVTDLVNSIEPELPEKLDEIEDSFIYIVGKNLYDPTVCTPQDGYIYDNNNSGAPKTAANYAITGLIPVEAGTRYIFSAGGVNVYRAFYFGGESGGTYIGATDTGLKGKPFVTPANCTFVGLALFAASHTTADYNAAIAAGQLEKGNMATEYEPYKETLSLQNENMEHGDVLGTVPDITEKRSQINLYDKSLAVDGQYINSGAVVKNATYAYTGLIPVKPNTQYNISNSGDTALSAATVIYAFDINQGYIGSITLKSYVYSYLVGFVTDSETYFIAQNYSKTSHTQQEFADTFDTVMLCYGTQRPASYSPYNPETVLLSEKLDNAYFNPDPFKGKRWLATGTSITWYDSKTYSNGLHTDEVCRGYVGNVARRKALLVTNEGISGSTLADISESSLINRYQDLDWANTDIATIEYGVNDFGHAVDIGTAEDAPGTTTFAACLKTVIEYALAQNPHLCLVICTEPDVRGSTANTGGHYLYEYTDVTLAIAKQYRLPVCDWFYHSGINSINKGSSSYDYMTADGTHPNDQGHMRMGAMLNQVFDSLMC